MSSPTEVLDSTQDGFFGPLQAIPDDMFQRSRDYKSEVDQIRTILNRERGIRSVADLGGTRSHMELLGAAGMDTVDGSADSLCDAVIALSSGLGRQVTNRGILDALVAMSRRLRPGGLLLFDALDGEALLRARLPRRGLTVIDESGSSLLCGHTSEVDPNDQVLRLRIRTWRVDGERIVERTRELTHAIRYFAPRELRLLLSVAGFEPLGTAPLAGQREPAWLRLVWARKS